MALVAHTVRRSTVFFAIFFYVHHVMSAGIFGGKKLRTLEAMNGSCRVCAFRLGIKFLIMNAINHDLYISED